MSLRTRCISGAAIVIAILSTVLLTLPGVFLGLWITGTELDLSSMMGLTMVIGIVTEVAIFYFAELDTGKAVTGAIDVARLSSLDRDLLKDTLGVVKRFKVLLRHRFHLDAVR